MILKGQNEDHKMPGFKWNGYLNAEINLLKYFGKEMYK